MSSIHGVAMTLTSPSPASLARLPDGASELGTPSKRPSGIRASGIYLSPPDAKTEWDSTASGIYLSARQADKTTTTALSLACQTFGPIRGARRRSGGAWGGPEGRCSARGGPVRSARGHDARASGRRRSAPSRRGAGGDYRGVRWLTRGPGGPRSPGGPRAPSRPRRRRWFGAVGARAQVRHWQRETSSPCGRVAV